ncbi:uracil-DNA glycosylase-like protein [Rhodotorula toruloides]|uniref:Uracil-DNA glycosylase-like protein n=1 Tax=Rhodotorula toruloides TaxID=5286 RepID=A0A511KM76_RHOTO|nr:uracil-DNA glycosylase-like protein [Rhodotorula toruloides]
MSRRTTRSSATLASDPLLSLDSFTRPTKRWRSQLGEKAVSAVTHQASSRLEDDVTDSKAVLKRRAKKRRKGDYADLGEDPLTDRIKEGLDVLFCGENPGIKTAELQLHYASPHNHFYKGLHAAGLTPSVLPPIASRTLPEDYNIGITNLIARPTIEASELTKEELDAAVPKLLAKVAQYRPKLVAFVGMKVADTVLRYFANLRPSAPPSANPTPMGAKGKLKKPPPIKAQIGLQNYALPHSHSDATSVTSTTYFYCLPSTSGRVAAYPYPVKMRLYATFGAEVAKLRATPPQALTLPADVVYYEAEKLDLPALAEAVEVKVEAEEAEIDDGEKGDVVEQTTIMVETVTAVLEGAEAGKEDVQLEHSLLVKLETSG